MVACAAAAMLQSLCALLPALQSPPNNSQSAAALADATGCQARTFFVSVRAACMRTIHAALAISASATLQAACSPGSSHPAGSWRLRSKLADLAAGRICERRGAVDVGLQVGAAPGEQRACAVQHARLPARRAAQACARKTSETIWKKKGKNISCNPQRLHAHHVY